MEYTQQQVARELRRIGVDQRRLAALDVSGFAAESLLRWLRWLPSDIGHDAFVLRLEKWERDLPDARAD